MGQVCMGQLCNGPSLQWAEFAMGRDVQLPTLQLQRAFLSKSTGQTSPDGLDFIPA